MNGSVGALHAEGDAVHGRGQQTAQVLGAFLLAQAAPLLEEADLKEVERVDMGVSAVQ